MKLFRKKDKLYGTLVKYSHKTALENPDMIIREFDFKIKELNDKLSKTKKDLKKYSFAVEYRYTNFNRSENPAKQLDLIQWSSDYGWTRALYRGYITVGMTKLVEFVDVDPEILLAAVEHNKKLNEKIAKLNKNIMDLEKEKEEFEKQYK